MAKVKVKKQSTFIDMTAMSDVTVLLLTFFMLTSTFIKKEPVQVTTPGSVSEIKIPETNILTVLIEPKGDVFLSLDKQEDKWRVLEQVGKEYKDSKSGQPYEFTEEEKYKFSLMPSFGVPIERMKEFLTLKTDEQDKIILSLGGIPTDSINNQFKSWVKSSREVNPKLVVAIKADATTPYATVKNVMNTLQELSINRYNLITSLKVATAGSHP
ncbi:MAG: biopolymer transporter ExbD [Dysgonamonadaceae bacterium]|jgi:biopolymer transport protein ExbD|nr:biopolymer transporter ExbD [Dysgonamonadaceae bacterium]